MAISQFGHGQFDGVALRFVRRIFTGDTSHPYYSVFRAGAEEHIGMVRLNPSADQYQFTANSQQPLQIDDLLEIASFCHLQNLLRGRQYGSWR